ncbi:alpha-amylase family glycosyl hydrolase [Cohnella thailandensis]|uniref:Alpha-amylase n=1 Tax=Cohnella thailandensis TaxID=557557 RepID=A0A841T0G2_9BACL|nr:alpha-amylase family glycosyl hydrolase [Cohnella thailandensis]MBB6636035.1 alpha-glucosidase C-terminal domain-containing protein [Cohnella thailandensis]MBP1976810.1 glycosidase [Cohnella thailandensis]
MSRRHWRLQAVRAAALLLLVLALASCSSSEDEQEQMTSNVFYEIFVRSFADSNGDGIGDLNGVTEKLDYVKSLGADGIWLMPINPSPSYHGYDVTDYYSVNSDYGTLDDLKKLLAEAHKRGIRVIMDLVVNHTSVEHPWFKEASASENSEYRDWYVWSGDRGGRIPADGAAGAPPWHALGGDDYLGIFWEGMPDLNFDNPAVRQEMIKIGRYWLEQGVDGFRLDAAKHIYGDFTSTASTPEVKGDNQAWWQEFRAGLNEVNPDAYLVGEVWDSTAVIGPYLNKAFDSAFNFDLASKILGAAQNERASDLGFTLSRVYEFYAKSAEGSAYLDAPFLSNHDQNRVMSALGGNVDHAKTAAAMLLTMPGNAFVYYGEELGMSGMKPDENIREPFPWNREPGAPGETTWMASKYRAGESVSAEAEEEAEDSLLHRYRLLIEWRRMDAALREGSIGSYESGVDSVMAYERTSGDERRLVLHNLSGQPQTVTLEATKAQPIEYEKIAQTTDEAAKLKEGKLELPPYSTVVLKP